MLLRPDTPSLICDADRRLRGSIEGSGANLIRGVEGLLVFVTVGRDVVDSKRSIDGINLESFVSSGHDGCGIWTVTDVDMPTTSSETCRK